MSDYEYQAPKIIILTSVILSLPFFIFWLWIREEITNSPSSSLVFGFEAILIISTYFFFMSLILMIKFRKWFKKYWYVNLLIIIISICLFIIFNGEGVILVMLGF